MENKTYGLDEVYFIQRVGLKISNMNEYDCAKFMPRTDICKLEPFCFGDSDVLVYSDLYDPRIVLMKREDSETALDEGFTQFDMDKMREFILNTAFKVGSENLKKAVSFQNGRKFNGVEVVSNLYTLKSLFDAINEMRREVSGYEYIYKDDIDRVIDAFITNFFSIDVKRCITTYELLGRRSTLLAFDRQAELIFGGWQRKRE